MSGPRSKKNSGALSQWELVFLRFKRHRLAVASFYIIVVLYLLAIFCEFFAAVEPSTRRLEATYAPPHALHIDWKHGLHSYVQTQVTHPITFRKSYQVDFAQPFELSFFARGEPYLMWGVLPLETHFFGVDQRAWKREHPNTQVPCFFLLGSDKYGRDVFSRSIYGSRISLSVGLIGLLGTFFLGMVLGGISGYLGGGIDSLIQRSIEIIQSFPQLPLWIALAAILPGDWSSLSIYFAITLLLSLLNWTGLARVVRGKILALRQEEYAVAARLLGASHSRILFLHLMPGFTSHIIVALTLSLPGMILGETALSFLGLGLRPPLVSWGVMLQSCMDIKAVSFYPWLLSPMFFIILLVLAFNFFGDGIRDAADPYGGSR